MQRMQELLAVQSVPMSLPVSPSGFLRLVLEVFIEVSEVGSRSIPLTWLEIHPVTSKEQRSASSIKINHDLR